MNSDVFIKERVIGESNIGWESNLYMDDSCFEGFFLLLDRPPRFYVPQLTEYQISKSWFELWHSRL